MAESSTEEDVTDEESGFEEYEEYEEDDLLAYSNDEDRDEEDDVLTYSNDEDDTGVPGSQISGTAATRLGTVAEHRVHWWQH